MLQVSTNSINNKIDVQLGKLMLVKQNLRYMSPLQTTWTRVLSLPNTSTYLFYSAISRNNRLLIDLKKFRV